VIGSPFLLCLRGPVGEKPGSVDADATGVEHSHGIDEPSAFGSEQLITRDVAVLKNDIAGIACSHSKLIFLFAAHQPGVPFSIMKAETPFVPARGHFDKQNEYPDHARTL
jgi:hypothetical protein